MLSDVRYLIAYLVMIMVVDLSMGHKVAFNFALLVFLSVLVINSDKVSNALKNGNFTFPTWNNYSSSTGSGGGFSTGAGSGQGGGGSSGGGW